MKTQIKIAFIAERLLFAVAKPFIFIRELAYSKIPKHLLPMAKAKVFARHIDFIYRNYKTSIPSGRKGTGSSAVKVKSLHHFQNIWHSLTGKELEIKL